MVLSTLDDWLNYIAAIHTKEIDLGLERVRLVAARLGIKPEVPVIIVAGTNGKGSTVAGLEAIYLNAGYKTGTFTTPYLYKHNEQVRINAKDALDADFLDAFDKVERARLDTSLTQFEFNTLAAMCIFEKYSLDVWILEVGLGGRLDAVNILDADVACVTNISLDHMDILGDTREKIGLEKAGIFRKKQKAVYGELNPPETLVAYAQQLATEVHYLGTDYNFQLEAEALWRWQSNEVSYTHLPQNALQTQNMAAVVMVVTLLQTRLRVSEQAIKQGLMNLKLKGRQEIRKGPFTEILDVAHNPASVALLHKALQTQKHTGKTIAVFSMLADKDIGSSLEIIRDAIDEWFVAPLNVKRGASLEQLQQIFREHAIKNVTFHPTIKQSYEVAKEKISGQDRLVVFGSFYTLAAVQY